MADPGCLGEPNLRIPILFATGFRGTLHFHILAIEKDNRQTLFFKAAENGFRLNKHNLIIKFLYINVF